jgi:hypothetical protein
MVKARDEAAVGASQPPVAPTASNKKLHMQSTCPTNHGPRAPRHGYSTTETHPHRAHARRASRSSLHHERSMEKEGVSGHNPFSKPTSPPPSFRIKCRALSR